MSIVSNTQIISELYDTITLYNGYSLNILKVTTPTGTFLLGGLLVGVIMFKREFAFLRTAKTNKGDILDVFYIDTQNFLVFTKTIDTPKPFDYNRFINQKLLPQAK